MKYWYFSYGGLAGMTFYPNHNVISSQGDSFPLNEARKKTKGHAILFVIEISKEEFEKFC